MSMTTAKEEEAKRGRLLHPKSVHVKQIINYYAREEFLYGGNESVSNLVKIKMYLSFDTWALFDQTEVL